MEDGSIGEIWAELVGEEAKTNHVRRSKSLKQRVTQMSAGDLLPAVVGARFGPCNLLEAANVAHATEITAMLGTAFRPV